MGINGKRFRKRDTLESEDQSDDEDEIRYSDDHFGVCSCGADSDWVSQVSFVIYSR